MAADDLRERIARMIALTYGRPDSEMVAEGIVFEVLAEMEELHRPRRTAAGRRCMHCHRAFPCESLTVLGGGVEQNHPVFVADDEEVDVAA